MVKVSTFFQNKIPTSNLIFKDVQNLGTNLIYIPELGNSGINFINKYIKKGYWDYIIIPPAFPFFSHKIYTNSYYKDLKKNIPTLRLMRRFAKTSVDAKSIIMDLTSIGEPYAAFSKSRSKKQLITSLFNIIESFAKDNEKTSKELYLVIDGNGVQEKEIISSLFYVSKLDNNHINIRGINGIILYGGSKFWPLTTTIQEKNKEPYLKLNLNILNRYLKEIHNEDTHMKEESPVESIAETKKVVKTLYDVHKKTLDNAINSSGIIKNADIVENPLEMIKNEVQANKHLKGKTFQEKLTSLFKEKAPKDDFDTTKDLNPTKDDKKLSTLLTNIMKDVKKLNKKYNGVIDISEDSLKRNSKQFYNPLKIIGFNDFHSYDRQRNEFGENLDQAIFDLIKSIETDPELDIKVLNIKTEITDNSRDRLKTYKVRLKHKFGHDKPYTITFHVPALSLGKYLKLGGNDWIMINQFAPKPIVKVNAKMVRVYTQFSTAAVHIKHHSLNENEDISEIFDSFGLNLKRSKKLKKPVEVMSPKDITRVIDKYQLPEFINPGLFVNMDIHQKDKK